MIKDSICLFFASFAINLLLTNNKFYGYTPNMALFLVPFSGLKEEHLKDVCGLQFVEDMNKETRLADSLSNAGVFALTKLTSKGVLVSGTELDARAVGNVLADGLIATNTDAAPNLKQDFSAAVVPFTARPARRPSIMGMQLAA